MPTAIECLRVLKTIIISQYISDVKRSNYFDSKDAYLLDFCAEKSTETSKQETQRITHMSSIHHESLPETVSCMRRLEDVFTLEYFSKFSQEEMCGPYFTAGSVTNHVLKTACTQLMKTAADSC